MKIFTADFPKHAGRWIYRGYQKAWDHLGYSVKTYEDYEFDLGTPPEQTSIISCFPSKQQQEEDYMIMTVDGLVTQDWELEAIRKSQKTFIFVQPNVFPRPWGTHSNFVCLTRDDVIGELNSMDNVYLWTFIDNTSYHLKWKKVHTVPLAYDSLSYKPIKSKEHEKYDISFIGGWANNGFDEKRKIMIDIFSRFKDSGLNCGFFVEKNLTHEQECRVLYNSKLTLNIHDAYQRVLGYDTNERTFKSLGLNGCLVSDTVGQLNRIFPNLKTSLDSNEIVQITKDYLSLSEKELNDIKEENRQNILDNHCYTNRVKSLLDL
jgi:hypothetical protein